MSHPHDGLCVSIEGRTVHVDGQEQNSSVELSD